MAVERSQLFPLQLHASTLGSTLKDLRVLHGCQQGRMINVLQCSKTIMYDYENDVRPIPSDRLLKYCKEIGLSVVLIDWELPKPISRRGLILPPGHRD